MVESGNKGRSAVIELNFEFFEIVVCGNFFVSVGPNERH